MDQSIHVPKCPEGTEDAVRVERDGTRSKFEGMSHTVVFVLLITV
eukprot:SAG31_NODE_43056_length_268_cov_6.177515_1_plen_45_part_00